MVSFVPEETHPHQCSPLQCFNTGLPGNALIAEWEQSLVESHTKSGGCNICMSTYLWSCGVYCDYCVCACVCALVCACFRPSEEVCIEKNRDH